MHKRRDPKVLAFQNSIIGALGFGDAGPQLCLQTFHPGAPCTVLPWCHGYLGTPVFEDVCAWLLV